MVIHEGKEDTDNRLLSSTQKTATAQPSIGVRQVTMVRISTSDATPKPTGEELQEILFGTSRKLLSVQAQIQACSAGQLILEPSPSLGGVVEVQLDQSLDHFGNDASRLIARASQQVGIHEIQESLDHYLDHILYCLPPGTGNWVASAVTNHYRSSYNNEHCAHLSVILHELGWVRWFNHWSFFLCSCGNISVSHLYLFTILMTAITLGWVTATCHRKMVCTETGLVTWEVQTRR